MPGERAVGYLDVREDMFWVPGHFPDYAVMPGVLIVEALAQVGAVALLSLPENQGKLAFFARHRQGALQAAGRARRDAAARVPRSPRTRGPIGFGEARGDRRRRARLRGRADVRDKVATRLRRGRTAVAMRSSRYVGIEHEGRRQWD